jgi:hypothetical protein
MAVNKSFVVKNGLRVGDSAEISGTLRAAGLKYPTSDGSYNNVIKTDGNGTLSLGPNTNAGFTRREPVES